MKIEHKRTDQNWPDQVTDYWFDVEGESYAISDSNGDIHLLDSDGVKQNLSDMNNRTIFDQLKSRYEKIIKQSD